MGILDKIEEVAGAVVAVERLEKVDANAGFLAKAAAAVAGYKGTELLMEKLESKDEPGMPEQPPA